MPTKLQEWLNKLNQKKLPKQNPQVQSNIVTEPAPEQLNITTSEINLLNSSSQQTPIDQIYIQNAKPYLFYLCLAVDLVLIITLVANGIFEYRIQKSIQGMKKTVSYLNARAPLDKKIQILADKITLYKSYLLQGKDFGNRLQNFLSQVPVEIQIDSYKLDESGVTLKAHSETPLAFASFISNLIGKKYVSSVQIKSALLNNVTRQFDVELEAR